MGSKPQRHTSSAGSKPDRRGRDARLAAACVLSMLLSAGFCLALSFGLGRDAMERIVKLKTQISLAGIAGSPVAAKESKSTSIQPGAVKPVQIGLLIAELRNAEMDLRFCRGIAMIISMCLGMSLFLVFRALQAKPLGPIVFGRGS